MGIAQRIHGFLNRTLHRLLGISSFGWGGGGGSAHACSSDGNVNTIKFVQWVYLLQDFCDEYSHFEDFRIYKTKKYGYVGVVSQHESTTSQPRVKKKI